jgi:acyl carrier protein
MGLDSVELVIEVEEAFDTPIPDEVAARMRTPGDIFDYLAGSGFKATPIGPCLSQAVFNRVRRAIVAEFDVDRLDVKPGAAIAKTIPQFLVSARRKSLLKRLNFRRPSPLLADAHWFRRDYGTFGELAKDILARNYGVLAEEAGVWNPKEAWNCLRQIISWQIGVEIEKVTRNANFVNDLGVD